MALDMTPAQRRQLAQFAPDHLKAIEGIDAAGKRAARKAAKPAPAPDAFTVDLSDLVERLTVGEAEEIEEVSGVGVVELFNNMASARVRGLAALVWVMRKRDDPKFTYKQAKALSLRQLFDLFPTVTEDDEEAPLEAASAPTA